MKIWSKVSCEIQKKSKQLNGLNQCTLFTLFNLSLFHFQIFCQFVGWVAKIIYDTKSQHGKMLSNLDKNVSKSKTKHWHISWNTKNVFVLSMNDKPPLMQFPRNLFYHSGDGWWVISLPIAIDLCDRIIAKIYIIPNVAPLETIFCKLMVISI